MDNISDYLRAVGPPATRHSRLLLRLRLLLHQRLLLHLPLLSLRACVPVCLPDFLCDCLSPFPFLSLSVLGSFSVILCVVLRRNFET